MANVARDQRNVCALRGLGWRTLIVWECDTKRSSFVKKLRRSLALSHEQ
jgi:G:T-mismatch repair DNA endonuclease (very short patch repair protein)